MNDKLLLTLVQVLEIKPSNVSTATWRSLQQVNNRLNRGENIPHESAQKMRLLAESYVKLRGVQHEEGTKIFKSIKK